jgi:hypothetical protein
LFGGWALYGEESEDILYLANGETRNVAGVVWIPSYLLYSGILADKDQFFTMTDTSSSLRVIFSSNLTEQDEQELIRNVRQYVSLNDVVYPSDNDFFSSGGERYPDRSVEGSDFCMSPLFHAFDDLSLSPAKTGVLRDPHAGCRSGTNSRSYFNDDSHGNPNIDIGRHDCISNFDAPMSPTIHFYQS